MAIDEKLVKRRRKQDEIREKVHELKITTMEKYPLNMEYYDFLVYFLVMQVTSSKVLYQKLLILTYADTLKTVEITLISFVSGFF